jgi:hypothetical protein
VHAWLRRYRQDELPGLTDRSHRHPGQLAADVEARVCELRRVHPRWGPRRNTLRPHQSLDMASPAKRFAPVPVEQRAVLGLWRPPELAPAGPSCEIVKTSTSSTTNPTNPHQMAY